MLRLSGARRISALASLRLIEPVARLPMKYPTLCVVMTYSLGTIRVLRGMFLNAAANKEFIKATMIALNLP